MNMKKPTTAQKVSAAICIVTAGVAAVGGCTKETLTWPYKRLADDQVQYEAAILLGCVLAALLPVLPDAQIQQIWKDQDERLSEVLEIALLGDATPSRDEEPYPEKFRNIVFCGTTLKR